MSTFRDFFFCHTYDNSTISDIFFLIFGCIFKVCVTHKVISKVLFVVEIIEGSVQLCHTMLYCRECIQDMVVRIRSVADPLRG